MSGASNATPTATPTRPPIIRPTNAPTATPTNSRTATPTDSYYVDSISGSDANAGTSADKPWRTLAPLDAKPLRPGSVVHFRRGSSWTGGLVIHQSGAEGNPITFTTYGAGNRPIFRNPGGPSDLTQAVMVNASWVVVEGLLVQDAQEAGIWISKGANNNTIRDIEVTNVGIGIMIEGQHNPRF